MRTIRLEDTLEMYARQGDLHPGQWPGLTVSRFTRPTRHRITSASLLVIAHTGALSVSAAGAQHNAYGGGYAVAGGWAGEDRLVVEASPERPCLCLFLQIDPRLVQLVMTTMRGPQRSASTPAGDHPVDVLAPLDDEMAGIVVRFLRSTMTPSDRRVLAPLYLQEAMYRILQGVLGPQLIQLAVQQISDTPVVGVLEHIAAHLGEPLTVEDLAARANLSPSAFTRVFREATGRSPYQYVKHSRLVRSRDLLDRGRLAVADVSRAVGYSSVSHFIKEFRGMYGETPGEYVATRTIRGAHPELRCREAV